jgi:hypothetical protein
MSFEADNTEHEIANEDIYKNILIELKLIRHILAEMTGYDFKKGDLDE